MNESYKIIQSFLFTITLSMQLHALGDIPIEIITTHIAPLLNKKELLSLSKVSYKFQICITDFIIASFPECFCRDLPMLLNNPDLAQYKKEDLFCGNQSKRKLQLHKNMCCKYWHEIDPIHYTLVGIDKCITSEELPETIEGGQVDAIFFDLTRGSPLFRKKIIIQQASEELKKSFFLDDTYNNQGVFVQIYNFYFADFLGLFPHDCHEEINDMFINRFCGHDGRTALHFAARQGYEKMTHQLLESGSDASTTDKDGRNTLMSALRSANIEFSKVQFKRNTSHTHRISEEAWNLLESKTLKLFDTSIVQLLLAYNTDINTQDNHGWTALMLAALSRRPALVKYFLEQGANPWLQNNLNNTALDLAKDHNDSAIALLLESYMQQNK